jgi:hypothetical protein
MQVTDGPVFHHVDIASLGSWLHAHLGFDPREGVTTFDWLATPTQTLAEVTAVTYSTTGSPGWCRYGTA